MHLLVLGGTRFVGRAVVDRALDAGAEVTLFNRGRTAPGLYPHVERVIGDRTADLSALAGRHFDAVIDCAAYDPGVVALSTGALTTDRYVFVSSVSVYADQSVPPVEGAALLGDDSYGGRKAACERIVGERFGDGGLIARSGLIVGPHDPTERFAYWPRRFRRPGPVLAPGDQGDPMQFIDVRDLARFLVAAASGKLRQAAGAHRELPPATDGEQRGNAAPVFNVVGPPLPMADLLAACRTVAGGEQDLIWMSTVDLLKAGVDPWMGVPLWIGDPDWSAANLVDNTRAVAAGLTTRPVAETVADVDAWNATRDATEPLSPEEERRLLAGR